MATIREVITDLEAKAKEFGDDVQVWADKGGLRIFPPSHDLPAWTGIARANGWKTPADA